MFLTLVKIVVPKTFLTGSKGGSPSCLIASSASSSKLGTLGSFWKLLDFSTLIEPGSCGMPSTKTCVGVAPRASG
jgi:hypothetical protein